jgi:ribosomal protein S18 acetylase RimI-like enzyme
MTALDVRALEERALNAWPAQQTLSVGGWVFRSAGGCTKRANSANALSPWASFETVRREAEAYYAQKGLPAIFRLSPLAPAACDAALEAAGYRRLDPSVVMVAPLGRQDEHAVELASAPSGEWLDGTAAANNVPTELRAAHDAIVNGIAVPACFATLRQDGAAIGFGLAVRERGAVGLFDIAVAPAWRGQGCGRAITHALMGWGQSGGAGAAYLQVNESNKIAIGLYERLGFREAYHYHYRAPPG